MVNSNTQELAYVEKLRDPRWQRKRLEILQRDEWECQRCGRTEDTLTVHHRIYLQDREPWNYPDELLVTLCIGCHEAETKVWPQLAERIIPFLKERVWGDDVAYLMSSLSHLPYRDQKSAHIDAFCFIAHWLMEKPQDIGMILTIGSQINPWVLKELTEKHPQIAQLAQETWEALTKREPPSERRNAHN